MKRWSTVLVACAVAALAGCSTAPRTAVRQPISGNDGNSGAAAASLVEDYGTVVVHTDAAGNWTQLTAVGTAPLEPDSPRSLDAALGRARADAYQHLVKFLGNRVQAKSTTRTSAIGADVEHTSDALVSESAAALLRGVAFEKVQVEEDRVTVRAVATPRSVHSAAQVKRAMLLGEGQ